MLSYIFRRLLLMIPTLIAITLLAAVLIFLPLRRLRTGGVKVEGVGLRHALSADDSPESVACAAPEARRPAVSRSVFRAYWAEGRDVTDPAVVTAVA